MNIAVTGASGYIGKKLVRHFLGCADKVLAVTRNKNKGLESLEEEYKSLLSIAYVGSDDMPAIMRDFLPDAVYSTSCCYESSLESIRRSIEANYLFPAEILGMILGLGECRKIRFISIGTSLPANLNLYARTKSCFVDLGKFLSESGSIQYIDVRLESFYGSGEPEGRFIPRSIRSMKLNEGLDVTDGTQLRDYVSSDDVIKVLAFLGKTPLADGNFYSVPLGSGIAPSVREILEYLKKITGSKSEIHFGAIKPRKNEPSSVADLSILRELGYKDSFTFWKDGMRKVAEEL